MCGASQVRYVAGVLEVTSVAAKGEMIEQVGRDVVGSEPVARTRLLRGPPWIL